MASSVDLFLNISNGLDENLKKSDKSLNGMNDVASKVNKNMTEMNKSSNKLNDNYDDIVESTKKAEKNTDKMTEALSKGIGFAKKLTRILIGGFTVFQFADVVRDTIDLNQKMSDLSYRMGEAGKTAGQLQKAVTDTMIATGAASEQARDWIIGLKEMRVATKDVKTLTKAGIQFSEITGASEEGVRNLIGSLNTMGGLGTKDIKGVLSQIVGVQRAFGLSRGEVDKLTESTVSSTQMLRQMGKSTSDITHFTKGVSKLAGAFASVGISAQTATDFVDKLLDPGAIEDNAFLYAKLGISMQDAIEGNVDPGKLAGGFKNLGSELKNMSGPAAAAMAKSLGMPLKELRQMSEMDMKDLQKTFSGITGASEDLTKKQQEQAKFQKNFRNSLEKVKGVFMDIALKAMPYINKLASFVADNLTGWIKKGEMFAAKIKEVIVGFSGGSIKKAGVIIAAAILGGILLLSKFKKRFASVSTDMGKDLSESLSTGISEAMDMGAKKSATRFQKIMSAASSAYTEDLKQRIIEGSDYAAKQASSDFYKAMAGTNLTEGTKKLVENTAVWLDKISMGAKPVSLINKFIEKGNAKMFERIKVEEESNNIIKGALEQKQRLAEQDIKAYQDRLKEFKDMEIAQKDLTASQLKEKAMIAKAVEKYDKNNNKINDKLIKLEDRMHRRKVSNLKNVSAIEKKNMLERIQADITTGKTLIDNNKREQEGNQLSIDALSSSKEALKIELENLNAKIKSGDTSAENLSRQLEIIKAQSTNNELLKIEEDRKVALLNAENNLNKNIEKSKNDRQDIVLASKAITKEKYEELEAQKLILEKTKEGLSEESQGYKDLSKKINEISKAQLGTLDAVDNHVVKDTFGKKIKGVLTTSVNLYISGIKSGMNKIGDSFRATMDAAKERFKPSNIIAAISKAGEGNFYKGLGKVFVKGAKDIGHSISTAGRVMSKGFKAIGGPFLLLGGLLISSMKGMDGFKKIMDEIRTVFTNLMSNLMPVIEKVLFPVLEQLINALLPLVSLIGQLLGPILGSIAGIIKALMPVFIELVKKLLPPILKVLSFLAKVVGFLIKTMGNLINSITTMFGRRQRDSEKALVESLRTTGKNFTSVGDVLGKSADAMIEANKNSKFGEIPEVKIPGFDKFTTPLLKNTKKTSENTNPESAGVTTKLYPAIIKATSSGFVKTEDAKVQVKGDPEKVRKAQQDEANKKLTEIANYMSQLVAAGVVSAKRAKEMVDIGVKGNIKKLQPVQEH